MTAIKGKGVGEVVDGGEVTTYLDDLTLFKTRGLIAHLQNAVEKANVIEREIGSENIYTLIAMGKSTHKIAEALGLTSTELDMILARTNKHRHNLILAKLYPTVTKSLNSLNAIGDALSLDKEQNNAARHHLGVVTMYIQQTKQGEEGANAVTVNNTIVVNDRQNVPDLPEELENVLDGDYEDVSP